MMKMRGELKIVLEDWDGKKHHISMFMHLSRSADDEHIAEIVMDQVDKQIDESSGIVLAHATLTIVEMNIEYEFSYMLGGAGNWEAQVMH